MQTKAILFDIDGTLVDSNELHIDAWDKVFRAAGHHLDRQALHDQIGKGGDKYVPALLPDMSESDQEQLADAHKSLFQESYINRVQAFPGATELLKRAQEAGMGVVLASSASGAELKTHLETLGAAGFVTATTSKDDVEESKPSADIFAAALGKVAPIEPEQALVIGDTPYDMEAARRCGIPAIGVRSGGFPDEALREAGASAVFDDVGEILERFDELFVSEAEARD